MTIHKTEALAIILLDTPNYTYAVLKHNYSDGEVVVWRTLLEHHVTNAYGVTRSFPITHGDVARNYAEEQAGFSTIQLNWYVDPTIHKCIVCGGEGQTDHGKCEVCAGKGWFRLDPKNPTVQPVIDDPYMMGRCKHGIAQDDFCDVCYEATMDAVQWVNGAGEYEGPEPHTSFTERFHGFAQGMLAGMCEQSPWLEDAIPETDILGIRAMIARREYLNRPDWLHIASVYLSILRERSERKQAKQQTTTFGELAQQAADMLNTKKGTTVREVIHIHGVTGISRRDGKDSNGNQFHETFFSEMEDEAIDSLREMDTCPVCDKDISEQSTVDYCEQCKANMISAVMAKCANCQRTITEDGWTCLDGGETYCTDCVRVCCTYPDGHMGEVVGYVSESEIICPSCAMDRHEDLPANVALQQQTFDVFGAEVTPILLGQETETMDCFTCPICHNQMQSL